MLDLRKERILLTGGAGFLGSFVAKKLLLSVGVPAGSLIIPRKKEYDLRSQDSVSRLFKDTEPTVVIHLAANVGGIGKNQRMPGSIFYDNAIMGINLIEESCVQEVKKFVLVGTVCSYPYDTPVPFKEDDIWNGYPEKTNAPYGIAKKSLMVMLEAYEKEYKLKSSVVVPVNLYGPHDSLDLNDNHVIPALIKKFSDAVRNKESFVECWGTGIACREFLYVEDAADGIIRATELMNVPLPINLGTGNEISIRDLANKIASMVGFDGEIRWRADKPDGQLRRCLDISRAKTLLGWTAKTDLDTGLKKTLEWYNGFLFT